jgi:hypothetical protein
MFSPLIVFALVIDEALEAQGFNNWHFNRNF